jgi:hypothetical protein
MKKASLKYTDRNINICYEGKAGWLSVSAQECLTAEYGVEVSACWLRHSSKASLHTGPDTQPSYLSKDT